MERTCRSCVWWNPDRDGEWGECENVRVNDYSSIVIEGADQTASVLTRPDFGCLDYLEDDVEHDA